MDSFSVVLTILVVLFAIALPLRVVRLLLGYGTLEKTPLGEGEELLFEDDGVRIKETGRESTFFLGGYRIRVTSQYLLIVRRVLFGKHELTYVVYYRGAKRPPGGPRSPLGRMYEAALLPEQISFQDGNGDEVMVLPLPAARELLVKTRRAREYKRALNA